MPLTAQIQRTGADTMVKLAKALVAFVAAAKPAILKAYGENVIIVGLILAIEGLSEFLPAADELINAPLDGDAPSNDNPALALGINPAAPAVVPPDYGD